MKLNLLFGLLIMSFFSLSQSKVDTIVFSHNSGIYNDSFFLTISNLNGDKIFYSDNGDYPNIEYKEPIFLKKSTTIRVKNGKTLKGYTRNYLFPGRKISLPVICITIKPSDLYDSSSGIYTMGPNASKEAPYKGANFHKNWERPAYIEFIDTNNNVGFNQKIGIKIFGQFSAMLPQKSFSFHARKKYGKGKIKYPLFPDLPFKKYKTFVLRNSGSDNNNSHIRDVMMTSLVKNFNVEVQDYRSCIVYLNGRYWGIYHIREKINERYLKKRFKVDKDSVAIMKHRNDVQVYGRLNYNKMLKFIKKANLKSDSNIQRLSTMMDIDNYLDYNISQVYFSNIDAGGNIRYWRELKNGSKWRWILYDTDFGFGLRKGNGAEENTLKRFTEYSSEKWPFPSWSTLMIRKLLENDSIKNIYIQKFTRYINTTFKSENVVEHITKISNSLGSEMPFHFKRWKRKPVSWSNNINYLKGFAKERPAHMFSFLKVKFGLDTTYKFEIQYNPEQGSVYFDSYKIDSGFNGTYFSPTKYKLKAESKFGYEFSHWTGGNTNQQEVIVFTKDTVIQAYFMPKDNSKYMNEVYFNEVVIKDSLLSSYVEIYNASDSSIDISGWMIKNGDKDVKINPNTILNSNSFYAVFRNSTEQNKDIPNSQFDLFKIRKGNELKIFSSEEELVSEIELKNKLFKNSNSIEFVNTLIENNWKPSEISSANKINANQEQSKKNNFIILISFLSVISLIIFTATFLFFRKRRKRLHSSTE